MSIEQSPDNIEFQPESELNLGIEVGAFALQLAATELSRGIVNNEKPVLDGISELAKSGYNFAAVLPIRGLKGLDIESGNIGDLPIKMYGDRWIKSVQGSGPQRLFGLASWVLQNPADRADIKDIGYVESAFEATVDLLMFPDNVSTEEILRQIGTANPNACFQIEDIEAAIKAKKRGYPKNIALEHSPRNGTTEEFLRVSSEYQIPLILDLGHIRENLSGTTLSLPGKPTQGVHLTIQDSIIQDRIDSLLGKTKVYAVHIQGDRRPKADKREVLRTVNGEPTELSELLKYTMDTMDTNNCNRYVLELRPEFDLQSLLNQAIGMAEFVNGIRNRN